MPRNLDLTALRAFATVAETGGVTRAAGLLNLTQSAVSMQIKRLEEGLGRTFFLRAARKLTLTPEGEQLRSSRRFLLVWLAKANFDLPEAAAGVMVSVLLFICSSCAVVIGLVLFSILLLMWGCCWMLLLL